MTDGRNNEVVEEPVRMIAVISSHHVKGVSIDTRGRDELTECHRLPLSIFGDCKKKAIVLRVEHSSERHREAALHIAATANSRQPPQLVRQRGIDRSRIMKGNRIPVIGSSIHRL